MTTITPTLWLLFCASSLRIFTGPVCRFPFKDPLSRPIGRLFDDLSNGLSSEQIIKWSFRQMISIATGFFDRVLQRASRKAFNYRQLISKEIWWQFKGNQWFTRNLRGMLYTSSIEAHWEPWNGKVAPPKVSTTDSGNTSKGFECVEAAVRNPFNSFFFIFFKSI